MTVAVILAGGHGTRLRPLTASIPKPLVRLAGRPLIDRIIGTLPDEVEQVIVAAGYLGRDIEEHFKQLQAHRELEVVTEHEPLGTAGALYHLRSRLNGTFLVLNGDVVSGLDLQAMLNYHRDKKAMVTVSVRMVEDAGAFGVIGMDDGGRITEFREKPHNVVSPSLINAGAYVMEGDVFEHMDLGTFSLEKEVFPHLVKEGMFGYRFDDFWIDCGTRENFLAAQEVLLNREAHGIDDRARINGSVINRPIAVEAFARIEGAKIGPNVYVENNVHIGEGTSISSSTIFSNARIGRNCTLVNAIVCPDAVVEDNTDAEDEIIGGRS